MGLGPALQGSGPSEVPWAPLFADAGVLAAVPTLEVGAWSVAGRTSGAAVLPLRGEFLRAQQAGVEAHSEFEVLASRRFAQVVVHLQRGRVGTQWSLSGALRHLQAGGRLLFAGDNGLGIKSAVKRLEQLLGVRGRVLANRARARVVELRCPPGAAIEVPQPAAFQVPGYPSALHLRSAVGAFSSDGLDPGSALLIQQLEELDAPRRIFDPGSGVGTLAFSALARFPSSHAVLAEVDARSVAAALDNAAALGFGERCSVHWWDATVEAPPLGECDLALLNPPFHRGKAVDLGVAGAMFDALQRVLQPGGLALVVANRTLPYERPLRALGRVSELPGTGPFKLLKLERR